MNTLPVKDMFYSLQGEGRNVGMAAFFIRLAGCNVGCEWCDEKNAWNTSSATYISIEQILQNILSCEATNCIITGGEPTLYNLDELTKEIRKSNIKTFLETSGVNPIQGYFDWITLSPKKNKPPIKSALLSASEIKVVIEKEEDFAFAQQMQSQTSSNCLYYLQPEYSKMQSILPIIISFIKANPQWRLSLQTHKMINIK